MYTNCTKVNFLREKKHERTEPEQSESEQSESEPESEQKSEQEPEQEPEQESEQGPAGKPLNCPLVYRSVGTVLSLYIFGRRRKFSAVSVSFSSFSEKIV